MRKVRLRQLRATAPKLHVASRPELPITTWNSERPERQRQREEGRGEQWALVVCGVVLLVALGAGLLLWVLVLPNLH